MRLDAPNQLVKMLFDTAEEERGQEKPDPEKQEQDEARESPLNGARGREARNFAATEPSFAEVLRVVALVRAARRVEHERRSKNGVRRKNRNRASHDVALLQKITKRGQVG